MTSVSARAAGSRGFQGVRLPVRTAGGVWRMHVPRPDDQVQKGGPVADRLMIDLDEPSYAALSRAFDKTGRVGFRVQLALALIPVLIIGIAVSFTDDVAALGLRFNILGALAIVSLLVLLFNAFWFRHYVSIGRSLDDHSSSSLGWAVWGGLYASTVGILLSIVGLTAEITYLLIRLLETPQGTAPLLPAGAGAEAWVSPTDMISLLALVVTLAGEVVALVLGLVLLGRVLLVESQGA